MSEISYVEAANALQAKIAEADSKIESIFNEIRSLTDIIYDNVSNSQKYDSIVSIEYLLVKLRIEVEFEHLKVKAILSKQETPASLRGIFMKRDQYLAQVILKLNNIRDDISTLQKVVYTQSTRTIKN